MHHPLPAGTPAPPWREHPGYYAPDLCTCPPAEAPVAEDGSCERCGQPRPRPIDPEELIP